MSERHRKWMQRLAGLDRRWLYLALTVALVVAMLAHLSFPDRPSVLVLPLYEKIEELPSGSPILISFEYTPSSAPELEPMAYAITRHAMLKGHRVCYMSLWSEGNNLIGHVVEEVIKPEFPQRQEGHDWVVLGYKAGNEMLINALGRDIRSMYTTDVRGRSLTDLAAMDGIDSLVDFALIVSLSAGTPGLKEWILYAGDPLGVPVGGGCNGAGTANLLAYYPRQLLGLMGGLKGAAEYETALQVGHPDFRQRTKLATESMGPQAVAHSLIVLFIVLGNLGLLATRRRRRGADR